MIIMEMEVEWKWKMNGNGRKFDGNGGPKQPSYIFLHTSLIIVAKHKINVLLKMRNAQGVSLSGSCIVCSLRRLNVCSTNRFHNAAFTPLTCSITYI